ncbi:MAG: hypothetical protein A2747_00920 [Candidatus Yonathbacteria bacterium RIFCSPHIGHO2_01_FULL_44_41]|uniref:Spore protein YkvP/CgeB glycosyl transferase-like domain-containing protein n=1 Tax=Candidatus Yonathbacteria bacterium RIFCSPHIGHO2_02_FULL_44_14 TaxID=1802724 RepID=A0A1G2S5M3_9BACT|nr:MAG: hypothetical protein A2747_00920 [Candidatus Yonathbacteria bacterium RIFCSPHIGHO2_01_FULL_44_41]OHA80380.1 MAG: hypothetical protein A3D51_03635 [Candidatus Yonathbacteria bacterium RIFCSPHIGHO2_02_FULL_44_14]OHA80688.1 MAG: hypothetical protein A3B06_03860 [Candidatus Yonathbacteria bacterium RIFCSPLOWO2_01_FULL_43_20]
MEHKIKIAIQNPMFCDLTNVNGWTLNFIKMYKPVIFVSNIKYIRYLPKFFYKHKLNPFSFRVVFSQNKLNTLADALVCFNGNSYLEENWPIKGFKKLKVNHLMDYTFYPSLSHEILKANGVDYVFGYNEHDKYCNFFKEKYPSFIGRVIPVPFGFGERFKNIKLFEERKNKCLALGSVNSFDDPVHNIDALKETNDFFLKRGEKFMHKFRRMLKENEEKLKDIMDSKLPDYPQTKNFKYDIVKTLNDYKMFVNCESLQYFPSGKTFEGPASGSVLICSDHQCFSDLGFIDGVNCIKHREFDIDDFKKKVTYYLNNPDELKKIQQEGTRMVRDNFSHKKIAQYVHEKIIQLILKTKGEKSKSRIIGQ